MIEVVARPGMEGDYAYIVDTWLKTLWPTMQKLQRKGDFFAYQRSLIRSLFDDGRAGAYVLGLFDDPSFVVSWMVCSGPACTPAVHYIHTRRRYRRMGFGTRMLEAAPMPLQATHMTPDGRLFIAKHNVRYLPQLLALENHAR